MLSPKLRHSLNQYTDAFFPFCPLHNIVGDTNRKWVSQQPGVASVMEADLGCFRSREERDPVQSRVGKEGSESNREMS